MTYEQSVYIKKARHLLMKSLYRVHPTNPSSLRTVIDAVKSRYTRMNRNWVYDSSVMQFLDGAEQAILAYKYDYSEALNKYAEQIGLE